MTRQAPFGRSFRKAHFQFHPSYTPLNHGSFGAFPRFIQETQAHYTTLAQERPDTFIVYDLIHLVDKSRHAIAPLLGVPVDEVVFVPNASTGINTVLRNLKFEFGDVIVFFSTIYDACEKTIANIGETTPLKPVCITLEYPIEDEEIVRRFRETVGRVRGEGKNVRIAMFDTVLTFPGARMPWEELTGACKELGVLSLIDGAHGIGHIDLTHLGEVGPDFFVSNCHKWLYTPRGCAVFHVPDRNQHLIRTCIPTSHGYQSPESPPQNMYGFSPFVFLFMFVATIDYTPYVCVPAAIEFRKNICGGEDAIRKYCWDIAREGGRKVSQILGTHVLDTKSGTMSQCCFANIKLPLEFTSKESSQVQRQRTFNVEDAGNIGEWVKMTAIKDYDTYLQIAFMFGIMWVRLSGQTYLELADFEWIGHKLNVICDRLKEGENIDG